MPAFVLRSAGSSGLSLSPLKSLCLSFAASARSFLVTCFQTRYSSSSWRSSAAAPSAWPSAIPFIDGPSMSIISAWLPVPGIPPGVFEPPSVGEPKPFWLPSTPKSEPSWIRFPITLLSGSTGFWSTPGVLSARPGATLRALEEPLTPVLPGALRPRDDIIGSSSLSSPASSSTPFCLRLSSASTSALGLTTISGINGTSFSASLRMQFALRRRG